jgi:hypothetical protein
MSEAQAEIDRAIAGLEKLPPELRRAAFFDELRALPVDSRERSDFLILGRGRFARGPYSPDEFQALAGFIYPPGRPYSPDEAARLDEHAAALSALVEARDRYEAARAVTLRAVRVAGPESMTGRHPQTAEQLEACRAAREAEDEALEFFENAQADEVRCRPHRPRPLPIGAQRVGMIARLRKVISG